MAVKDWIKNLQAAEKEKEAFVKHGRRAYRAYKGKLSNDMGDENKYEFNLFWANIEVLKSALYANAPKPLVKREFDDYMDQPARVAGIMMERILSEDLCTEPEGPMHTSIALAVDDRLIAGLGQVWLRYEPTIEETQMEEVVSPDGQVLAEATTMEDLIDEQVITDYVYWEDFFWSPARTWGEVWWVARRVYMTPQEMLDEFGEEAAKAAKYTLKAESPTETKGSLTPVELKRRKAEVYEVWSKRDRSVCFYEKGEGKPLKDVPDPLDLPGFFPCPRPIVANVANGNFMPESDYHMVQSQYVRIDILARRIFLLEEAIRVAGVYDKSNAELKNLLNDGALNVMIPVDNWALLSEKGGLEGAVDWFPLEKVTTALQILRQQLPEAQKALYELNGLSDIMRGTTHPRETLGAQEMKAQYSSSRLQNYKLKVATFVGEILKLKASIVTGHFQPQTILKRSNIMLTPDAEYAMAAVQLLKDEWSMCYRLKVDADQMAIPDYNAEQQGRVEFIGAAGQFISMVFPLLEKEPGAAPFLLEILKWGIAGFHAGATIEGVFDKAIKEITKRAQQPPPPPPPDPAMVKAQADVKAKQMKTQADIEGDRARAQATAQNQQMVTQAQTQATVIRTQADIEQGWERVRAEIAQGNARAQADVAAKRAKARSGE